ncbi:MAG: OsmC family peroxiredoxin [Chitinispirillaceae bacterium]
MPTRSSKAIWEGTLKEGKGKLIIGNNTWQGSYSAASRFENASGTNPEELLGAAHAGCFSQAFSMILSQAGYKAEKIETTARVSIEKQADGFAITRIDLQTEGIVPGVSEEDFDKYASAAKEGCPVSQLFKGAQITVESKLLQTQQ